ncbi:hypothetical protein DL771_004921 [Monosporascus sp. 5C6A]|nr:hypothetical protein DL771_004921 [Monosporascus sp. 5C6A]
MQLHVSPENLAYTNDLHGFDAYAVSLRIRPRVQGVPEGDFPGWVNIASIVTFPDGSKYHVDVGFGGGDATLPLPLIEGLAHRNLGTQGIRLVRDWMPTQQKRRGGQASDIPVPQSPEPTWNSFYAFAELEFIQADFEFINCWTGHSPGFYQALRFCSSSSCAENLGGRTRVVQECKTEEARIEALDGCFGIRLTEEERLGIRGWVTELPQRESAA